MQHGILDSGFSWVMNFEEKAPAFITARAGYDVWIGNSRGNTYSLGHRDYNYQKHEEKYWSFDWE